MFDAAEETDKGGREVDRLMLSQMKLRAAMVTVALLALLTMVGGLVISQAAGQSGIRALVYDDAVRFVVEGEDVSLLRAEVFNLSGKRLFDSGPIHWAGERD